MKFIFIFLAVACGLVYWVAACGTPNDAAGTWCKQVQTGNSEAAIMTQLGEPAGASISNPYYVDGLKVVDWTWADGVIVSWHDGYIVVKSCAS